MPDPKTLIRTKALSLGFHAIGFAPATLAPETRARLQAFLAQGHHGEMAWMAARTGERAHPQSLWPEARTVISLGLSYAPATDPLASLTQKDRATISVYARNRDYHDVIKGMLKHLAAYIASRFGPQVKVFVDTAPVMEKPLAQQAGLGWQGKHTNLLSRQHGNWLLLGEVMTTLDLTPDTPETEHCGTCTRCLDICPTKAFPAPFQLDATRCISYLTIEHQGPIPEPLRPLMGNRIYGCDDCLAVCPWNRFAHVPAHPKLAARPLLGGNDRDAPRLAELATLDDTQFRNVFAGSPIKRTGRDRFVRNVLNAIGNSADPTLLPQTEALRADPSPIVSDAAAWAAHRLRHAPKPRAQASQAITSPCTNPPCW